MLAPSCREHRQQVQQLQRCKRLQRLQRWQRWLVIDPIALMQLAEQRVLRGCTTGLYCAANAFYEAPTQRRHSCGDGGPFWHMEHTAALATCNAWCGGLEARSRPRLANRI